MAHLLDKNYRVIKKTEKKCPRCKLVLGLEFWSKSKNTPYCKTCWRARTAEYRKFHGDRVRKSTRKSWHKNKLAYNKVRRVGGSVYEQLYVEQKGVCAICKQPENGEYKNRLCVDHNHKTGAYRGLLCQLCNMGLGGFYEDVGRFKNAILYIERYKVDD